MVRLGLLSFFLIVFLTPTFSHALFAPAGNFSGDPCIIDETNEATITSSDADDAAGITDGILLTDTFFTECGATDNAILFELRSGETESVYTITGFGTPARGLRLRTDVSIECEDGVILRGNGSGIAVSADETVAGVSDGDLDFSQIINCQIEDFNEGTRIFGVTFFDVLFANYLRNTTGILRRNDSTSTIDFVSILGSDNAGMILDETGDDMWLFDTTLGANRTGFRSWEENNHIIAANFVGRLLKARCDGTGHIPLDDLGARIYTVRNDTTYQTRNGDNIRDVVTDRTATQIENQDCGGTQLKLVVSSDSASPNIIEPFDAANPDPGDYGFIISNAFGIQLANDSCDGLIASNQMNYNREGLRIQNRVHNEIVTDNDFTNNRNSMVIRNHRTSNFNNKETQCEADPTRSFCGCYLVTTACTGGVDCVGNFDPSADRVGDFYNNRITQSVQNYAARIDRVEIGLNFGAETDPDPSDPFLGDEGAVAANTVTSTHPDAAEMLVCHTRSSDMLQFENNEFTRGIMGIVALGSAVPLDDVSTVNSFTDVADWAYYDASVTNNAQCRDISATFCGDGAVDNGEQCDDGNTVNGDGCDAACIIEPAPAGGPPVPQEPGCGFSSGGGIQVFVCRDDVTECVDEGDVLESDILGPCCSINFEKDKFADAIPAGTIMSDQLANVTISAENNKKGHPDEAIIFDSSDPTGNDFDLGTPNHQFGGPGLGGGGNAGQPGENAVAENNILIIAEDIEPCDDDDDDDDDDGGGGGPCLVDDPDDEAKGGTITFAFDEPTWIEQVEIMDIQGSHDATVTTFDDQGAEIQEIDVDGLGNNSVQFVTVQDAEVATLTIEFEKSGGVLRVDTCVPFEE